MFYIPGNLNSFSSAPGIINLPALCSRKISLNIFSYVPGIINFYTLCSRKFGLNIFICVPGIISLNVITYVSKNTNTYHGSWVDSGCWVDKYVSDYFRWAFVILSQAFRMRSLIYSQVVSVGVNCGTKTINKAKLTS